jgi:N-acetylmuramoyl-L-alanine amidase
MPAILVEVSTLSNEDEVELLINPDYREKIALALSRGIRSYAKDLNRTARNGS